MGVVGGGVFWAKVAAVRLRQVGAAGHGGHVAVHFHRIRVFTGSGWKGRSRSVGTKLITTNAGSSVITIDHFRKGHILNQNKHVSKYYKFPG